MDHEFYVKQIAANSSLLAKTCGLAAHVTPKSSVKHGNFGNLSPTLLSQIEASFEVADSFFSKDLKEKQKLNRDIVPTIGEDGKQVLPTYCGYDGVGTET